MSPGTYSLLADVLVALHLVVVGFVIFGLALVLLGRWRGWAWVRNPIFRLTHLGIVGYIAFNAIRGELCFLTLWETDLRISAGQERASDVSFMGRLLRNLLYVEEVDQTVLHAIYLAFALLVAWSWFAVRPRFGTSSDTASR